MGANKNYKNLMRANKKNKNYKSGFNKIKL